MRRGFAACYWASPTLDYKSLIPWSGRIAGETTSILFTRALPASDFDTCLRKPLFVVLCADDRRLLFFLNAR
jgi:hypothetical protein